MRVPRRLRQIGRDHEAVSTRRLLAKASTGMEVAHSASVVEPSFPASSLDGKEGSTLVSLEEPHTLNRRFV